MLLLPLEQVDPSDGPLAYLDLFERVSFETVSRACREEARAPALWRKLVVSGAWSSKEGRRRRRLVNEVLTWLCGKYKKKHSLTWLLRVDALESCCLNLTNKVDLEKAVPAGCASLTSLDVTCCESMLTDESIKAVAAGCASLTSLSLIYCFNLTDEAIKAVAAGCPSLTSLSVYDCSKLTDESIKAVAAGCASLKKLNVRNCPGISHQSEEAVKLSFPARSQFQQH